MYGLGSYNGIGGGYDPYSVGYYNMNPPFVGATAEIHPKEISSDVFVSRKKDDKPEIILMLGALAIAVGAYLMKGKLAIGRAFK